MEAAVAGGAERAELLPEERPAIKAVIAEIDPRRLFQRYAETQPGIHARMGPLMRVLAQAAAADPDLAAVAGRLEAQRHEGMGRFAKNLAERGFLRADLTVDEARDLLWTLNSHAIHDMLVIDRGWTRQRYRDWLADTLARTLLPDLPPSDAHSALRRTPT